MIKHTLKNVHDQKIDQWIELGVNVCLIGDHGCGKTQRVLEGFQRNGLNYAYFSGATLDPWLHLIGVPEITGEQGDRILDFILPKNLDENVEAIFVDEYNRTPKIVRNALLEMQQFKTINGRKFPNLRIVWGAINPPKGEDEVGFQYDVDEPDPAQLDRFHVIVEIPSIPDPKYFRRRFGNHVGSILIKWWKKQAKEGQLACSPRRLEYVGDLFFKGIDVTDILPPVCNSEDLVSSLSVKEEDAILEKIKQDPSGDIARDFLSDPVNYYKVESELSDPVFFPAYQHLSEEIQSAKVAGDPQFERYVLATAVANKKTHWSNKLIKKTSKTKNLELVASVLDSKWPEAYALNNVDIEASGLPVSTCSGDKADAMDQFMESVKNGNYNIPSPFYSGVISDFDSKSFANTYWHKRAIYFLRNCHMLLDAHLVVNIMLSMYNSLQESTISDVKGFDKLFNGIFLKAYNRLSNEDRVRAAALYGKLSKKHNQFDKISELLSQTASGDFVGCLPKDIDNLVNSAITN